jgi:hypothetical protein
MQGDYTTGHRLGKLQRSCFVQHSDVEGRLG